MSAWSWPGILRLTSEEVKLLLCIIERKKTNVNNQEKIRMRGGKQQKSRRRREFQVEGHLLAAVKEKNQIIMKTWTSLRGEKKVSSKNMKKHWTLKLVLALTIWLYSERYWEKFTQKLDYSSLQQIVKGITISETCLLQATFSFPVHNNRKLVKSWCGPGTC